MEIIIGKNAGFCGGVKRSVEETNKILKDGPCYCLGELVHNNEVVNSLEEQGLKLIDNLNEVEDNSKVIIRAHGIAKEIYEEAERRNIELIDLTCPKVLLIHELVKKQDNFVIVVGKKTHPEIIGTVSYLKDYRIIEKTDEVYEVINYIKDNKIKKVSTITQTTYSSDKFKEIESILKKELNDIDLIINNNICNATEIRQKEVKELAEKVDIMIIIGGKNSSNTQKLYDIANNVTKSYVVETYKDLEECDLKCNKIGIMAGASTPKKSIDDVVMYLERYN